MKLLKVEITNFGSYAKLEFDYQNRGLTLIHGATGSGKSTLEDAAAWVLFGVTAKDGNAYEIKNWDRLDYPTNGTLDIEIPSGVITILRTRGKNNNNDLYWYENDRLYRGKDLNETQKLIEGRLGVSKDLYLAGAYFNEFSPTAAFFTANASDRRDLFEKLANLELPAQLAEKASSAKKETRKAHIEAVANLNKTLGRYDQLKESKTSIERDAEKWSQDQEKVIKEYKISSENFETEKVTKIANLEFKNSAFRAERNKNIDLFTAQIESVKYSKCPECKQPNKIYQEYMSKLKHQVDMSNPYPDHIKLVSQSQNHFTTLLAKEIARVNPFEEQLFKAKELVETTGNSVVIIKRRVDELEDKMIGLSQLYDLSFALRAQLLRKVIKDIEKETNRYLDTYFDTEMRIAFTLNDSDNLEIDISKNGHECVYRQLSKGQRGLLKLCFSVAVMAAAANKSGIHFNSLFFDEALDGLDADLKIKAFGLFSELETRHDSVFVIEHADELKGLFSSKIQVRLESDLSIIEEDHGNDTN